MTPLFKDLLVGLACACVVVGCALAGMWLAVHK